MFLGPTNKKATRLMSGGAPSAVTHLNLRADYTRGQAARRNLVRVLGYHRLRTSLRYPPGTKQSPPRLRRRERSDLSLDLLSSLVPGYLQVVMGPQVEPELRAGAEAAAQPEGGVGAHGALAAHDLVDARGHHADLRPEELVGGARENIGAYGVAVYGDVRGGVRVVHRDERPGLVRSFSDSGHDVTVPTSVSA
jgi:hypothetical protein